MSDPSPFPELARLRAELRAVRAAIRVTWAVAGVGIAAAALLAYLVGRHLTAPSLPMIADGPPPATLTAYSLTLLDLDGGRPRLLLSVPKEGPALQFLDAEGDEQAELVAGKEGLTLRMNAGERLKVVDRTTGRVLAEMP